MQGAPSRIIVALGVRKPRADTAHAQMLGDTPYEVEATLHTGVRTIALRSSGWADADLWGALTIYNDCADLLAHLNESPLAP